MGEPGKVRNDEGVGEGESSRGEGESGVIGESSGIGESGSGSRGERESGGKRDKVRGVGADANVKVGDSRNRLASARNPDHVFYPMPHVRTALYPTKPGLYSTQIIKAYGATDLLSAATRFLVTRFRVPESDILLSPHHKFDVWHRLYINHSHLPFAPSEPLRRDVVRACPPTYSPSGRALLPARFDTALYLEKPNRQRQSRLLHFTQKLTKYRLSFRLALGWA